ncbi:RHS repeat-associated core domain-containing protein [Streptomyces sp. NPDC001920]
MGHRYYDPTLGRFTQPDPSGQETNPCLYAGGDLINNSDPTGLFSLSDALDAGESIFSTATGCLAGIGAAAETGIIATAGIMAGRGARRPRSSAVAPSEASSDTTTPTSSVTANP